MYHRTVTIFFYHKTDVIVIIIMKTVHQLTTVRQRNTICTISLFIRLNNILCYTIRVCALFGIQ